jgi:predicted site-specific integrase-resolvase
MGEEKSPAFAGEGKARTISEQARRAGVSRQLLYRAIRAGALKTFVPYRGGNQRITDGEIAKWMVSRRAAA